MNSLIRENFALLFAGLCSFVLMGAGQALYGPALPIYASAMSLDLTSVGWVISAHWIGCFIGVGGLFLAKSTGTPRLALTAMALGTAGLALASGWSVILLSAVVFGVGYGCATAVFNPRMLSAFGARGPAMVSLLNASFGIGAIAAPLAFVALSGNPALCYGIIAVLCGLVWIAAGKVAPETATAKDSAAQGFRPAWGVLGIGMVAVGMEASTIGLGPTALMRTGITDSEAAILLSMFFVAFLLARILLTITAHLISAFDLFIAAVALTAVLAFGAAVWDPSLCFVAMGASIGIFFPGFFVTAIAQMGRDPRVAPTIIASGLVGGIVAPLVMAQLIPNMGARGFFWVLAVLLTGLAVAAVAIRLRQGKAV